MKRLIWLAIAGPLLATCLIVLPVGRTASAQVIVGGPMVQTVAYRPWVRPYVYPRYGYGYQVYRPYYDGRPYAYGAYYRPYAAPYYGYYRPGLYW